MKQYLLILIAVLGIRITANAQHVYRQSLVGGATIDFPDEPTMQLVKGIKVYVCLNNAKSYVADAQDLSYTSDFPTTTQGRRDLLTATLASMEKSTHGEEFYGHYYFLYNDPRWEGYEGRFTIPKETGNDTMNARIFLAGKTIYCYAVCSHAGNTEDLEATTQKFYESFSPDTNKLLAQVQLADKEYKEKLSLNNGTAGKAKSTAVILGEVLGVFFVLGVLGLIGWIIVKSLRM